MTADLHFYFDPVCPFAWMTSKWVRQVAAQREYDVDWRFISLRVLNAHVDYDAHFPPEYEAGHTAGLRLLRVAARARSMRGREAIGPLYAALGQHIFESEPVEGRRGEHRDTPRVRRADPRRGRPARRPGRRAGRRERRRRDPRGDGRGARPDGQGRRDADPALPAGRGRHRVLRPGHQPAAQRRRGGRALGARRRPRLLPRVRGAEAEPARAPAAARVRRPAGRDRHAGGLARREPPPEEVAAGDGQPRRGQSA